MTDTASKTVLIIDDETTIQMVVQYGLQLAVDWTVWTASSGLEGVQVAQAQQPDVILLDVMMPEMDGIATFQALQANPRTCSIPVIFLTANAHTADHWRSQSVGVTGVITKPFNSLHLADRISSILKW